MPVYKSTQRAILLLVFGITVIIQIGALVKNNIYLSIGTSVGSIAIILGIVFLLPANERTPHVSGNISPEAAQITRERIYGAQDTGFGTVVDPPPPPSVPPPVVNSPPSPPAPPPAGTFLSGLRAIEGE